MTQEEVKNRIAKMADVIQNIRAEYKLEVEPFINSQYSEECNWVSEDLTSLNGTLNLLDILIGKD